MTQLRVLIVDDSPAMRVFVRRVMGMTGIDVGEYLEASNGEEALAVLREKWVDAVLTDINMPVMNGEELLRRMSADEVLRSVPVLVISTDRTDARIQKMMSLGARGYLTKPFAPEALREVLESSLEVAHAGA